MSETINKTNVENKMISLGVYKKEFVAAIERYVQLSKEYKKIYSAYKKSGYECEIVTDNKARKSPTVATLEGLRRDILSLEDALGLTPRGLLKLNEKAFEKTKKSKLEELI